MFNGFPVGGSAWRQWSPHLVQFHGTTLAIVSTLLPQENYYKIINGDWVVAFGQVTSSGSSGLNPGAIWLVGFPFSPVPLPNIATGTSGGTNVRCVGSGTYFRSGTGVYAGSIIMGDGPASGNTMYAQGNSTSAFRLWTGNTVGDSLGENPAFAIGSGDMFSYSLSFPIVR